MSVRQMAKVWELNVSTTETLILLALADHAQDDGNGAYPSIKRLAWKANVTERTVQRTIRQLEERGIIEVVGNWSGGRGRKRQYRLHLEKGDKKTPFSEWRKGDTVSPNGDQKGDIDDIKRVTLTTQKGDTVSPPSEPSEEPSEKPSDIAPAKPSQRSKPRNPIWDALVEACGEPATASEKSDMGKTVRELKEAGATLEEIEAFPLWWESEMPPGTMLTHRCYRSHFGKFRSGLRRAEGTATNGQQSTSSIDRARRLIERRRKSHRPDRDALVIYDRPSHDDRRSDARMGDDVREIIDVSPRSDPF